MRFGLAVILVVGLTLAPLGTTAAQPPEKGPRVGYLNPGSSSDPLRQRRLEAFRQSLRELGYVDGRNIWTCPDFVDTWVKLPMLRDPTAARRPGG
jgi:hypothetical protein